LAPISLEKPTLIERFVGLIPLPYPLAALIWAVVLPGTPGFYVITQYVANGSSGVSLALLPNAGLSFLLPFYLFLIVRYTRLRVVEAESPLSVRLSGGPQEYERAFERMTQTVPVIAFAAILGTLLLAIYASVGILPVVPWLIAVNAFIVYLNVLAFSTYLWEFVIASLGLYRLGSGSLKLASFLEDRMMGVRPMGNLALSLTTAYFGGLLVTYLLLSTFLPSSVASTAMLLAFLLLGVALFFLPLGSIHAKMQAEKRRLLREIGARYPRLDKDQSRPRENATLEDVQTGLARLTDLQEVEMLDRKIASLPTWPFDIQVVSRFVTIVLSVTAVLVSRLITGFLKI
jgi:small-conductance mechanosensitive channel